MNFSKHGRDSQHTVVLIFTSVENRLTVSSNERNRKSYFGEESLPHVLPKITGSISSQSQTQFLVDNSSRKPVS